MSETVVIEGKLDKVLYGYRWDMSWAELTITRTVVTGNPRIGQTAKVRVVIEYRDDEKGAEKEGQ